MSLKIVPLVSKSNNSAVWSPVQCVTDFLKDIQAGTIAPTKLLIVWFSENPDGSLVPHRWFANMNSAEEVALVTLAQHLAIEGWKQ